MSGIDRAVVLAAGLGTRMRAAAAVGLGDDQARMADAGLKAMVPVGRPFLDHALHALADAGVRHVCLVIGPSHDVVRQYYASIPLERLTIEFAVQPIARGTADAVAAAEAFIGSGHVLVVNGDNVYPVAACRQLLEYGQPSLVAFSRAGLLADGLIEPDRITRFALVAARDGWLERTIEKPDPATLAGFGPDPGVSMNCWVVPPAIVDAARRLPPSPRGELEMPLAVQALVDAGTGFRVFESDEPVIDLSNRSDIAAVEARLRGREVWL